MDSGQLLRANALAAWHSLSAAPAPDATPYERLYQLAEHSGCAVDDDKMFRGTNIQGMCQSDNGMILLHPDLRGKRRAFVLAHELGHFLLKHPGRIADTNYQLAETVSPTDLEAGEAQSATGLDVSARDTLFAVRGYSDRDRWETEANAFAAELLVPTPQLRQILESSPGWTVTELCERFGVTETLLHTQLAACLVARPEPATPTASALPVELDGAQEAAANVSAPALVVAGPGSGKTRVLVERFARLVKGGVDPRRILALTFANKAASEMRERLAALLAGSEYQAAIEVSTFHALGWQLLREYGHHIGLTAPKLITPGNTLLLMRPHLHRLPLDGFTDLRRPLGKVAELMKMVSRCKDEDQSPAAFALLAEAWTNGDEGDAKKARDGAVFYAAYNEVLRKNSFVDYGDLVTETLRLFDIPAVAADIRSRFDHVLVDEFQDINYASGLMVRALGGETRNVWAVGDAKQSIYGFRGASPVNIAGFADAYPGAARVELGNNYRSLPAIVCAGQAINVAGMMALPLAAHREPTGDAPCVTIAETATLASETVYIADEIEKLTASGIAPGEIAVLCRSGSVAEPIACHLSERGIAHTWGGDLEERPAFKTLMASLLLATDDLRGLEHLTHLPESLLSESERRALLCAAPDYPGEDGQPSARALLRAAARGLVAGIGAEGVASLRSIARIAERLEADARPFTNLSRYIFEEAVWLRERFTPANRNTLATRETLSTVRQTLSFAARFAERQAIIGAIGDTTTAFLEFVTGSLEAGGLGLPAGLPHTGDDSVHLLTAHRAKGLEWRVVFVPGLAHRRFPAAFQGHRDFTFPPGTIHTANPNETPEEVHEREEASLFYVAATRARDRLYLSRARKYPFNHQNQPAALLPAVRDALREADRLHEYHETPEESAARELRFAPSDPPETFLPTILPDPVTDFALSEYEACPRRYLYRFVYGLTERDSAYLSFHGAVAQTQKQLLHAAQSGTAVNADALFDAVWKTDGTPPSHWFEPFYAQVGREMATTFASRMQKENVVGLQIGKSVVVQLPAPGGVGAVRQVRVTIDERDGNTVRRRRTGKTPEDGKTPDVENKDVLYALHAESLTGALAPVLHSFPRYQKELPVVVSPRVKTLRVAKLRDQCDAIERGAFARNAKDNTCTFCAYRLICLP
ncbi:MAG: UvrD-helicase domain-containing protein [Armatimonadetes bacterium]|nr:UvrD-helicase domain-containing protein [Armatimonadota bacterium]